VGRPRRIAEIADYLAIVVDPGSECATREPVGAGSAWIGNGGKGTANIQKAMVLGAIKEISDDLATIVDAEHLGHADSTWEIDCAKATGIIDKTVECASENVFSS
jgi:hypothetical protein